MKLIHKLIAMGLLSVATVAMADDASPVLQSVQASQTSKQGGGQIRWVKKPNLSMLDTSYFSSGPELCFAIDIPLFQHCSSSGRSYINVTAKMVVNGNGRVKRVFVNTGSPDADRAIIHALKRARLTPHHAQDEYVIYFPMNFSVEMGYRANKVDTAWKVELLREECKKANDISQCDPAKLEAEFRRLGVDQLSNESTSQN